MTTKVIYIPLDERACNYRFPSLLAEMTDDMEVLVPPRENMGMLKQPADVEKLWEWVFENAPHCKYAVLSVDTLIYGNIINSRIHHRTMEECKGYLANFKKLKDINPDIEVHAFNLVARVANYNHASEDPDYWAQYGTRIWKYSYLTDKINRGHATEDETEELATITGEIPEEYLRDFLERRKIDRFVNLSCLDLVEENVLDYLVVPKDDTAEYGYAALDQSAIAKKVLDLRLMDRVMVYPGADEVGSILFTRVFNIHKGYTPQIYLRYSSVLGPTIIPRYEDRPLHEGIKAQITSLGGIIVEDVPSSDMMLAVHSPGKYMIESGEQYTKDVSYYSHGNTHEFLRFIDHYISNYGKPCGLADVAFSNGADNEMMIYAKKTKTLEKISAYGGWNTSQNTIGVVLAHTVICSYYQGFKDRPEKERLSREFLLRKIVEDWLFQSNVLHKLLWNKEEFSHIDPYMLEDHEEFAIELLTEELNAIIKKEFKGEFLGKRIEFGELSLPWKRIFDIDFDIQLV